MRYILPRKAMPSAEHPLKQKPIERHEYYEGDMSGGHYHEEYKIKKEKDDASNRQR